MISYLYAKDAIEKMDLVWCFVLIFLLPALLACAEEDSECIEPCGIMDGHVLEIRSESQRQTADPVHLSVLGHEVAAELIQSMIQWQSLFDEFDGEETAVESGEGSDEGVEGFELVALSTSLRSVFNEDEAMLENASDIFDISGRFSTRIYAGLVIASSRPGASADVAMYWIDTGGRRRLQSITSTAPGFAGESTLSSLVLWIANFPANCDAWVRGFHSVEFEIDDDGDGIMDRIIASKPFLITNNFYLPSPPLLHVSQDELVEQEPLQVRLLVDGYSRYTLVKSSTPTFDEIEEYDVSSGFYEFVALPVGTYYLRGYASNSCGRTDFGNTISVLVHEADGLSTDAVDEESVMLTEGEMDSEHTDDDEIAESVWTAVSEDEVLTGEETIELSGDHVTGGEEENETADTEQSDLIEETPTRDPEDSAETGGETDREGSDDCGEDEHTQREEVSSDEEGDPDETADSQEDCNGQECSRMWHDFFVRCPSEDPQCTVYCWYAEAGESVGSGTLLVSLTYFDMCMWGIDCNAISGVRPEIWYSDLVWLMFLRASLDGERVNGYVETDVYGTNLHFSELTLGCP